MFSSCYSICAGRAALPWWSTTWKSVWILLLLHPLLLLLLLSCSLSLSLSVCLSDCRRCDPRLHRRHDSGGEPQWSWDSLSVFVRTVHRPTDWGQALPDMFGRDAAGWQPVRRPVSVRGERTWMWAAQPRESEWFKRLEMRVFFLFFCYLGFQCVVFIRGGSCSCDFLTF